MLVKRLSEHATIPKRAHPGDAGLDLSSAKSLICPAHGKCLVPTDLSIRVPFGTYGRIAPRSGLAWKNHLDVGAGVIDKTYSGNVGVVLFNHSNDDFKIEVGDRIAQLIIEKIELVDAVEVTELLDTDRGNGGFGSTGVSSKA